MIFSRFETNKNYYIIHWGIY